MLRVEAVEAIRGETRILHGVDLEVGEGEMVALVGRNGMGKTTLLRSIVGLCEVIGGRVTLDDIDITNSEPHKISRLGLGVVPEGRGIFPSLTVFENLRMGLPEGTKPGNRIDRIVERFPILADRLDDQAGSLSGGQQQILAIARALVCEPRLLLIDEFSEGIQPSIVQEIGEMLVGLAAAGVSVLLVEQNARLALDISSRAYILEKGRVPVFGNSDQLLADTDLLAEHLVV